VIAKTAHIGRIIVSLPGPRLGCQLFPRLKVPQESQKDESGTAYRATKSSERRRNAPQNGRGIIVRSTWRLLCLKPDRSRHLKFFIEKSGNSAGAAGRAGLCIGEDEPHPRTPGVLAVLFGQTRKTVAETANACEIFLRHLTR
jgi:hypothetical protein